nr:hypothetical protein [Streptomyces europaeiscabiei]
MTLHHTAVGVDGSLVFVRALDRAAAEVVRRGTALRVGTRSRTATQPHRSWPRRRRAYDSGIRISRVETVAAEGGAVPVRLRESAKAELTVVGHAASARRPVPRSAR